MVREEEEEEVWGKRERCFSKLRAHFRVGGCDTGALH